MIRRVTAAAASVTFVLAVGATRAAAGPATTTVPVWGGALVLSHPPDWKSAISGPLAGPTVTLTPGDKGDFQILITAIVSKTEPPSDEVLAKQVRQQGEGRLPTAAQSALEVKPVKGAEARGYVFHLTDKEPEKGPGTFKELHQGSVVVGPLMLAVTVLTHSGDTATVDAALAALASAHYNAAPKR